MEAVSSTLSTHVLPHLRNVKPSADGYTACCPAHDDKQASLSIGTGNDGKVLLKCFAGCSFEEIVKAIRLKPSDLMGEGRNTTSNHTTIPQRSGCTLQQYAALKRLPVNFLQEVGCSDIVYMKAPAVRISYRDLTGQKVAVQYRIALPKGEQGDNRFRWKKGDKPCLYGQWRLDPKLAFIVLVEGPSDCHTLWFRHVPALGFSGADTFKEDWAETLDEIPLTYVVIEPDTRGETVKKWLAKSKIRDRVRLISLGEHKDPSGLYLDDPDHFTERFQAALDSAVPWTEQTASEASD